MQGFAHIFKDTEPARYGYRSDFKSAAQPGILQHCNQPLQVMFLLRRLTSLVDKLVFSGLLLARMQLPNFVLQYQQVVTSHFIEIKNQLHQYQRIADRYYNGDIQALVQEHRQNTVTAIRAEAGIINQLAQRHEYLLQQVTELKNKPLYKQLWFLSSQTDSEMIREVLNGYIWTVPLTPQAIISGLTLALALNMAIYLCLAVVMQTGRLLLRHRTT